MRRKAKPCFLPLAVAVALGLWGCPPAVVVVRELPQDPSPPEDPAAAPRATLLAFLSAVAGERPEEAYELLSGRWRAQLTPTRLAADRVAGGPLATDRLERARLAAARPPALGVGTAAFPIGDGHAVKVVLEPTGWKLDTLE